MAEDKPSKRAHNFIDLTGQTFGKLTVLSLDAKRCGERQAFWKCQCNCGTIKSVRGRNLRSGQIVSCGCHRKNLIGDATRTHGMRRTREYLAWTDAKSRCFNPNVWSYRLYGGRGITMCDEWRNSFEAFYRDMGPCPDEHSIDRIDPNGNYCKSNCRWADKETQRSNKTNTVRVEFQGEVMTLVEVAARTGIPLRALNSRRLRNQTLTGEKRGNKGPKRRYK